MSGSAAPGGQSTGAQHCYRHPGREAYISCQRCERTICPDCMREASVGFQCPECIAKGAKNVRTPRTIAGGAIQSRPGIVTTVLIGLNVGVFVLTDILRITDVTAWGAMQAANVVTNDGTLYRGVVDGGYWRLLTSAFLHAGFLHIIFNVYALYLFGPFVERALGTWRYLAAYVTSAVVASVFVYWLSAPGSWTVGASGAVFGLFGMALVLLLKAKEDVRGLLVLLGINAVISVLGARISWEGHLGGFVAGCVLGVVLAYAPRPRRTLVQVAAFVVVWGAVVAAVGLRTAQLTG